MDIDKVIQILSEAIDEKDWDLIKELLEELIYEDENPIKEYEKDKDLDENLWGWQVSTGVIRYKSAAEFEYYLS